ncbi:MAG: hypothetical protein Kow0054_26580 [Deferrisoma sp.]
MEEQVALEFRIRHGGPPNRPAFPGRLPDTRKLPCVKGTFRSFSIGTRLASLSPGQGPTAKTGNNALGREHKVAGGVKKDGGLPIPWGCDESFARP